MFIKIFNPEMPPGEHRQFLKKEFHVQLRPFSPPDLDRVMDIESHSFEVGAYPRSQFEEIYRENPQGFYVAEISGEVIGYVIGCISDGAGELSSLAVDLGFRELGIGRRLLDLILEKLDAKEIKTCSLRVRKMNEKAVRFYKGIGFEVTEAFEIFDEPGAEAYVMKINI